MSNVIKGYFGPKKNIKLKAAGYIRDFKNSEHLSYEEKFAALFDLCDRATSGEFEAIIVAYPEMLGDNEEELIRNLSLLSHAGLLLTVAEKSPRIVEGANNP